MRWKRSICSLPPPLPLPPPQLSLTPFNTRGGSTRKIVQQVSEKKVPCAEVRREARERRRLTPRISRGHFFLAVFVRVTHDGQSERGTTCCSQSSSPSFRVLLTPRISRGHSFLVVFVRITHDGQSERGITRSLKKNCFCFLNSHPCKLTTNHRVTTNTAIVTQQVLRTVS